MNTRELFELASLDVLGLLDDREREAFEKAFRAATPSIQAQVRREQTRFSQMSDVLPQVEAPAGLRAKVLAAVRDAIAAVRTEPIARIGSGSRHPLFNSAPIWRAACIGFATAALILGGFFYSVVQANKALATTALSNATAGQISQIAKKSGINVGDLLLAKNVQRVSFSKPAADAGSSKLQASLWANLEKGKGLLVCDGLQMGQDMYVLVISSEDGQTRRVAFPANSGRVFIKIESLRQSDMADLKIVKPNGPGGQPEVLLRSSDV